MLTNLFVLLFFFDLFVDFSQVEYIHAPTNNDNIIRTTRSHFSLASHRSQNLEPSNKFYNNFYILIMGLQKQYLKYGQTARDKIFGLPPDTRRNGPTPLSMLISHGAKFNNSKYQFIWNAPHWWWLWLLWNFTMASKTFSLFQRSK